ncbi:MAG: bile acid:sodium symporter family protein [Planctomycetaceae bacterium]|nr:MAG: bile acid:sodium symporter family protein [Planctomycetaceae bacterium]
MPQRHLLLWLILSSLLAYLWPGLGWVGFDPFVLTKQAGLLMPLIAVAMFSVGCLLPPDEIRQLRRYWPAVLGGTAVQYGSMPLLAWGIGSALRLPPDLLTGMIVVGCVPGAMASNVLTLAARGNVSYSVSLTTSASLFSPLIVPFTLAATLGVSQGLSQQLDKQQVFSELLFSVVGPVLAGYGICRVVPAVASQMSRWGPLIANATILWIIAVVVGLNRDRLGGATPTLLLSLLLLNLLGYTAGWTGGRLMRLPDPMRRALTLEVGMQNAGLGTGLVLTLFPETPSAALPTAAYTFGCMLTGTLLAQYWSRQPNDGCQHPGPTLPS